MARLRLGVSRCLLGDCVRYDGGHKLDRWVRGTLGACADWVPVCPEVECGLSVPREPMHLEGPAAVPRLVAARSGADLTDRMDSWIRGRLARGGLEGLDGFVFKSRSPSCAPHGLKAHGAGLFARAFAARFPSVPAEDEGRLQDEGLRDRFIERAFVAKAFREARTAGKPSALVGFHTDHKLQLLAHGPVALRELGAVVAAAGGAAGAWERYGEALARALELETTPKRHANALQHAMGWLKKRLSAEDKAELLEAIDGFRLGLCPLLVPLTLLRHHVRVLGEPYLARQSYLHPSPEELRLRYHA